MYRNMPYMDPLGIALKCTLLYRFVTQKQKKTCLGYCNFLDTQHSDYVWEACGVHFVGDQYADGCQR